MENIRKHLNVGGLFRRIKLLYSFDDKAYYKNLIKLSTPIMLQQALSILMFLFDSLLVGSLGESSIAAVSIASQFSFLSRSFAFGSASASGVFAGQYWGKKDTKNIRSTLGLGYFLAFIISLMFFLLTQFGHNFLFAAFNADAEVASLGVSYLHIVNISFFFEAITLVLTIVLRSCGITYPVLISTAISLFVDTVLSFILIFGKFGLPALGIQGAAIATLTSTTLNFVLLIGYCYIKQNVAACRFKDLCFKFSQFKKFIITSLPILFNEVLWSLANVVYVGIYGWMGTEQVVAMDIFNVFERTVYVVFVALGSAGGVIIGNTIGKGDKPLAHNYAKRLIALSPLASLLCSLLILVFSNILIPLYNIAPTTSQMAYDVMLALCVVCWLISINFNIVMGCLRPAGDAKYSSLVEVMPMWLISIPCVYIAGIVLELPLWTTYLSIIFGEITKCIIGLRRIKSKRWIHDLTIN